MIVTISIKEGYLVGTYTVAKDFLATQIISNRGYYQRYYSTSHFVRWKKRSWSGYIKSKLHEYILYKEKVKLLKHSRLLAPFAKIVIHFSANCKRSAFSISYNKFVEYNIKKKFLCLIMTNILFKNIKWKMSKNERDFLYRKVAAALLFFSL